MNTGKDKDFVTSVVRGMAKAATLELERMDRKMPPYVEGMLKIRFNTILSLSWQKSEDEHPFEPIEHEQLRGKGRLFNGNDEYSVLEYDKVPGIEMMPYWYAYIQPLTLTKIWYGSRLELFEKHFRVMRPIGMTGRAKPANRGRDALLTIARDLFHFQHIDGRAPFHLENIPSSDNNDGHWKTGVLPCMITSLVPPRTIQDWLANDVWTMHTFED